MVLPLPTLLNDAVGNLPIHRQHSLVTSDYLYLETNWDGYLVQYHLGQLHLILGAWVQSLPPASDFQLSVNVQPARQQVLAKVVESLPSARDTKTEYSVPGFNPDYCGHFGSKPADGSLFLPISEK